MITHREPFPGYPTAQVMLLGTFHFQERGLDRYQPQHGFDVRSQRRQREIEKVVESLGQFRATKVAIERTQDQQEQVARDYRAYLRDEFVLCDDEIHQLGLRLARRLGHARLWIVIGRPHCTTLNWPRGRRKETSCCGADFLGSFRRHRGFRMLQMILSFWPLSASRR